MCYITTMSEKNGGKPKKNLSMSKAAVLKRKFSYTCVTLRFADQEHYQTVKDAIASSKMTMNSWLIHATLETARAELRRLSGV